MTAKGKINASNVRINDRIIVRTNDERTACTWSATKTGENVIVARVTGKSFRAAQGPYEARGKFVIETTAGTMQDADPIQTMWLAPEDAAGIKRAYAEAVAEDAQDGAWAGRHGITVWSAEQWRAGREADHAEAWELQALADAQTDAWEDRIATERKVSGANRASSIRGLVARDHTEALQEDWNRGQVSAAGEAWDTHLAKFSGAVLPRDFDPEAGASAPDANRHIGQTEGLTLHSHDGKVDTMNNASETSAPAQPTKHTGSTVVALIERVWDTIRADHPELPEVVVTTGSGEGVKWGHFRPESWKLAEDGGRRHEFFLASEALAKGATQVLQTTIHEAAHTLNRVRGTKDTSRQNRYHNAAFRKTAEELGLEHKGEKGDATHGFSFVTLTAATKTRYAALLAELERELKLTGILPFWLGGTDEEDEKGGEKITGKPVKGKDEGETKSGPVKAVCDCEEPVIIRISQKVMDMGVVRCDDCNSLFHRP